MPAILLHFTGSGQLSSEIASKKPLASLMANSHGTVMLIDAYVPLQGEGESKTDSLAAKLQRNFLEVGDFLCRVLLSQYQELYSKYLEEGNSFLFLQLFLSFPSSMFQKIVSHGGIRKSEEYRKYQFLPASFLSGILLGPKDLLQFKYINQEEYSQLLILSQHF